MINLIRECGYIEAKWANDSSANTENGADDATQDTAEDDEEEELVVEDVTELNEEEDEVTPVETPDTQTNGHYVSVEEEAKANMLGQTIAAPEPVAEPLPVFPNPPQVAEAPKPVAAPPAVPAIEPIFNFLQESQIDLESPHMDPAVVMVHPPKRPAVPVHQVKSPAVLYHFYIECCRVFLLVFLARLLPIRCFNRVWLASHRPSNKHCLHSNRLSLPSSSKQKLHDSNSSKEQLTTHSRIIRQFSSNSSKDKQLRSAAVTSLPPLITLLLTLLTREQLLV